ncbi:MAG: S-layer homology domain-containing protein [Clostridia bacterium]|nr:S-layer homology domain-containing protein [Clostridia bacterium]
MGFKRLLCGVICIAVLTASLMVSAADFSDVKGHWSEEYVNAMVKEGYIKGYEDGTFRPDKTITNTEALILLSRMLGVDDADYKAIVDDALEAHSGTLSKYSTDYKEEMAYLLYRGVIDKADLDTYISSANKNKTLLRYQCAILLTKLLGADEEVKNSVFISSSYSDTAEIPSDARPYVEYVRDAKIMEGMGVDSYGDPIFGPNESVTRGQMAKMLSSLIEELDISLISGSVTEVDDFEETVTVKSKAYAIEEDTIIKLDGENADIDDIKAGMAAQVIIVRNKVSMISVSAGEAEDEPIRGIIASVTSGQEGKEIIISDIENSSSRTTYEVAEDVVVVIEKAEDLFSKLKSNQYVELTVEDDVVVKIEVLSKNITVAGTLVSKDITSKVSSVTVSDTKGNKTTYICSEDGVEITRNGKTVKLSDLIAGDSVSLKLTYHRVTKITAESKSQSSSGTIKSITHTESGSYLEIKEKENTTKYSISNDAIIKVDGAEATAYDLRPGSAINFRAESTLLTKIETTKAASSSSIEGTVTSVQSSHDLLFVDDGEDEITIGVNSSTTIKKASGATVKLSAIATGSKVTVLGSNATGMFIATVIVVH